MLKETLLSIFNDFIPNEISKFDYKTMVWMNKEITLFLKRGSKLTKIYYNDLTDHSKILLIHTANERTKLTIPAKEKISSN